MRVRTILIGMSKDNTTVTDVICDRARHQGDSAETEVMVLSVTPARPSPD